MKITIDTNSKELKLGQKSFFDLSGESKMIVEDTLHQFLINNTPLSEYENDCMWMSYRYCIGRSTITANMHAIDIWKNCRFRLTDDQSVFVAFDMNREVASVISCQSPRFYFPSSASNMIYATAVDIVCEFIKEYNITSEKDFLKYKEIQVILTDNDRGYKFEPTLYNTNEVKSDNQYYSMRWLDDLLIWNDVIHLFDKDHYHKFILVDGTECEWVWSWIPATEKRSDGFYYNKFGYEKVRIPINKWNGTRIVTLSDDAIKTDIN